MQKLTGTEKEIKHPWEPNAQTRNGRHTIYKEIIWQLCRYGSGICTSSPTEFSRYSPSSGPPNPPPLPSLPASSKPPSSNPSSGSFPKKAYCPASKFSAVRNVRSSEHRQETTLFNPDYEQQPRTKRKNITGNNSSRQNRFFLLRFLNPKASLEQFPIVAWKFASETPQQERRTEHPPNRPQQHQQPANHQQQPKEPSTRPNAARNPPAQRIQRPGASPAAAEEDGPPLPSGSTPSISAGPPRSSSSSAGSKRRRASGARACWRDFLPGFGSESWAREIER